MLLRFDIFHAVAKCILLISANPDFPSEVPPFCDVYFNTRSKVCQLKTFFIIVFPKYGDFQDKCL